jgi:hypothetical protein
LGCLLSPSVGYSAEEDVHRLVRFLEVAIALVGLFLAFLVVRVLWFWSVLECSLELVALLGGVVAVQMPQALLFQQVLEAARGLLRVVFRRALDSRDSAVWLALAIGTRVVVGVTALVPVVVAVATRVLLALAMDGVVLGVSLVFFIGLGGDHVLEVGDGARAVTTEVFEGATVVETVLEEVDDLLVGDVDYGGALVEKAPRVLAKGLALFLVHHCQVHVSTRAAHGEVEGLDPGRRGSRGTSCRYCQQRFRWRGHSI